MKHFGFTVENVVKNVKDVLWIISVTVLKILSRELISIIFKGSLLDTLEEQNCWL
jgi:hypothetical protein